MVPEGSPQIDTVFQTAKEGLFKSTPEKLHQGQGSTKAQIALNYVPDFGASSHYRNRSSHSPNQPGTVENLLE